MKRLVLLALACSIFSACGGGDSASGLGLSSSFSLSDVRAPAAGKINLIFENLESTDLTGAFFSPTGLSADFVDLMPQAQSFPGKHFVVFDQAPATYAFNYKFANGTFSPIKTQALTTAGKNVSMGANQTNTGTVTVSTPVTSTSSSSSTSSTSSTSSSSGTFTAPTGFTCQDFNASLGSKCSYFKVCYNSSFTSGSYVTSTGTFSFNPNNTTSIQTAATNAVNSCQ